MSMLPFGLNPAATTNPQPIIDPATGLPVPTASSATGQPGVQQVQDSLTQQLLSMAPQMRPTPVPMPGGLGSDPMLQNFLKMGVNPPVGAGGGGMGGGSSGAGYAYGNSGSGSYSGGTTSPGTPHPLGFAHALLHRLGDPITPYSERWLLGWMNREGTAAENNPLAVTGGSNNTLAGNSAGVTNLAPGTGVPTTADFLNNGNYPHVLNQLATGHPQFTPGVQGDLNTWSGGGYGTFDVPSSLPQNQFQGAPNLAHFSPHTWTSHYSNGNVPANALVPIGAGKDHWNEVIAMRPDAAAAFADASQQAAARGVNLDSSIAEAYRSGQVQAGLYANRASNPNPVAAPGTSNHGYGIAFDMDTGTSAYHWMLQYGPAFGFHNDVSGDPSHFDYVPTSGQEHHYVSVVRSSAQSQQNSNPAQHAPVARASVPATPISRGGMIHHQAGATPPVSAPAGGGGIRRH